MDQDPAPSKNCLFLNSAIFRWRGGGKKREKEREKKREKEKKEREKKREKEKKEREKIEEKLQEVILNL